MSVTAKLKVRLLADEVVIGESDDPALWQRVLTAMQRGGGASLDLGEDPLREEKLKKDGEDERLDPSDGVGKTVHNFAHELGVSVELVEGACGPSLDEPFIRMDDHHWEALKKNTPSRGPASVSSTVAAATLLALWYKHAKKSGGPSLEHCQTVLDAINVPRNTNGPRSIKNCMWLQLRDGAVVINPAERSKAVRIAKAYCLKTKPEGAEKEK